MLSLIYIFLVYFPLLDLISSIILVMFPIKFLLIILVIFNSLTSAQTILFPINVNCTLKHNGRLLNEGESIEMKGKFYKVENCILNRAYQACGSHLLQMISIACEILDRKKQRTFRTKHFRRFLQRKLLTEACCHTLCTVDEMTRYCP